VSLACVLLALAVVLSLPWPAGVRGDEGSWTLQSSGVTGSLNDVWGASSADVLACGVTGTMLRYDGAGWSPQNSGTGRSLYDLWGSSANNIFAVGSSGIIQRYQGASWKTMASDNTIELYGVWGSSASDVFAVGSGGRIMHYDGNVGGTWVPMASGVPPQTLLFSVWGTGANDVYAVGSAGTVLHYDGASWSNWSSKAKAGNLDLWSVWGSSGSDVYVVGDVGTILHFDGSSWRSSKSGTESLYAVWGTSSSDVFVVGSGGKILRNGGSGWTQMTSGTAADLKGVWGAGANDVYAVGDGGVILHYGRAAPAVTSVEPASGHQGQTLNVAIEGSNLGGATAVSFGPGVAVSITGTSATGVTAGITISDSAVTGDRDVSVSTPGGTATKTAAFRVDPLPSPTVASVSPGSGIQGQSLTATITGADLGGATAVDFGPGITVTGHTVKSGSQITAGITISGSAAAGPRDVAVTTPGGTAILEAGFAVAAVPPSGPFVSGVAPGAGACGETVEVVVSGSNLNEASEVSFGAGIAVDYVVEGPTLIRAGIAIDAHAVAGMRDVVVTTPEGSSVLSGGFEVLAASPPPQDLKVTGVSPGSGACGEAMDVVISGSSLGGASEVDFGAGIVVSYVYVGDSETQITASIVISSDALAGPRDVTVTGSGGADTLEGGFEVVGGLPRSPEVIGVSPGSGACGRQKVVVINGANLTGASQVSFGAGITVSHVVESDAQIRASITIADDAATGLRDVVVTTPDGSATLSQGFEVVAEAVRGFSPFTPWFWIGLILFGVLMAFCLMAMREKKPEPKRWSLLPPSYQG
jgi:hypothetical protein